MPRWVRWSVTALIVIAGVAAGWWVLRARSTPVAPEVVTPSQPTTVWGEVRTPDGRAAFATVIVLRARPHDLSLTSTCDERCGSDLTLGEDGCPDAARQLASLFSIAPSAELTRVRADANGVFTLPASLGDVVLWAELSGVGVGVRTQRIGRPSSEPMAPLELQPAQAVKGSVHGDGLHPIGQASLALLSLTSGRLMEATSADDGSFDFGALPGDRWLLVASAVGVLPSATRVASGSTELSVVLNEPRRIAGRVMQNGRPVAGVEVTAHGEHRRRTAKSGRDGSYAFAGLSPGRYRLEAIDDERAGSTSVSVPAGIDLHDVELVLSETATLLGTVRDENRKPIANAEITCSPFDSDPLVVHSGERGEFVVRGVPPGAVTVTATATGHQASGAQVHQARGGQREPVEVVLRTAALVRGTVRDAQGQPVSGAEVFATPGDDDDLESTPSSGVSNEAGVFTIDGLKKGRYQLRAEHARYLPAHAEVKAPEEAVALVFDDGAQLSGVVLDEDERPVASAKVGSFPDDRHPTVDRIERAASTDANGGFTLSGLPRGDFWVGAFHEGRLALEPVHLGSAAAKPVTLRLPAGRPIAGDVVDGDGRAVEGAEVRAESHLLVRGSPALDDPKGMVEAVSSASAVTGGDGRFVLEHLVGDGFSLSASAPGYSTTRTPAPVATGSTRVRLTLQPLQAVSGRVIDENRRPVTAFELNGKQWQSKSGTFTLPAVAAGSERLEVRAPGFARAVRVVTVAPPKPLDDIVLSRARELELRVVDAASDAPVAGVRVTAELADDATPVLTSADGRAVLSGLERSGNVVLTHQRYGSKTVPFGVRDARLEVKLDPGASVRGVVRSGDGSPMSGVNVWAMQPGGARRSAVSDGEGRFEIGALGAGEWLVRPFASGLAGARFNAVPVTLSERGHAEVELQARGRGNMVRLTVTDASWRPVRAAVVLCPAGMTVSAEVLPRVREVCLAPNAEWPQLVFQAVPSGKYQAVVMSLEGAWRVEAVELTGDREMSVRAP